MLRSALLPHRQMAGHSDLNPERRGGEGRERWREGEKKERERSGRDDTRGGRLLLGGDAEGRERVGGMEGWRRGVRENGEGWRMEGERKKANVPLLGRFDEMR